MTFAAANVARLKRRTDALPDERDYRDTGCEVAPACLSCPLPQCRYDVPGGARAMLNVSRNASIRAAHREGEAADAIAARFGISRSRVFRVLADG